MSGRERCELGLMWAGYDDTNELYTSGKSTIFDAHVLSMSHAGVTARSQGHDVVSSSIRHVIFTWMSSRNIEMDKLAKPHL